MAILEELISAFLNFEMSAVEDRISESLDNMIEIVKFGVIAAFEEGSKRASDIIFHKMTLLIGLLFFGFGLAEYIDFTIGQKGVGFVAIGVVLVIIGYLLKPAQK